MLKRVLILSLLFLLFVIAGCDDKSETPKKLVRPVKTMVIKAPKTSITRTFPGKVIASKEAILSFQVPGRLVGLLVLEGDKVESSRVLANLDPEKYQHAYDEANAAYLRNEAHYRRAQQLVKKKFLSEADFDNRKALYQSSLAKLKSAKKDLNDTVLKAPFPGVISRKYVDNHEHVKAKQPIFKLQNLKNVDVEINIPENVIVNLRTDAHKRDKPKAIFDSVPNKVYPVTLKEFSSEADPETQTYRVVLTMASPKDVNILPGMTVSVRVKLPDFKSGGEKFIVIPAAAVFSRKGDQAYVWVVDTKAMTVKKQPVKVSRMASQEIHVLSGLKPGDRIVVAGVHYLQDGEKISLLDETTDKTP